jgi:hypothetical protein
MVRASTYGVGSTHCVWHAYIVALVYPYVWAHCCTDTGIDLVIGRHACIVDLPFSVHACASSCLRAHGSMHIATSLPQLAICERRSAVQLLHTTLVHGSAMHACMSPGRPGLPASRLRSFIPPSACSYLASHACPLIGVLASFLALAAKSTSSLEWRCLLVA